MEETSPKTPEMKALQILEEYEGSNNFILNLKHKKFNSKSFTPTRSQAEYIINYQNTKPKVAKKWVKLDSYFAKKLKEDKLYTKEPTEIYVEKLLVEKDKSYHIWGKIFSGETIYDFWLPKTALLKDNEVKNVVIDYEKYNHRAPMTHQKEAIEKLVRNKKFILADDMGLGKTTSTIISALETGAKKILIICPASLKINWQREIANYSDRSVFLAEGKKFSSDSDFVIVNYDILKNFHDIKDKDNSQILKSNFDLMIADECFTYETTVMTDVGEIKIGDIVENNLDVNVLTYNHVTKKTEYKKIFRWLKKSKDTIYQIKLQNGVFIECTGNHKFFTKNRGYVRADQLTKNDDLYELSKGINKFLQSRHWKFVIKNYYRNRWEITHNKEVEILRQKENRNINFVRMESITILERGSYDKSDEMYSKNTRVYDLEIKDNHNYFVNGILVSNCHYVSNPQSNRTKIVNEISKNINRVWLLTGTPMTNRPMNYYNLLNLVDSPVAANWMAYAKRYCNGYQFSVGKRKVWNVTGASNLEELRERTQTHILRRLKEDVLDLPDKIITPVYLRLKSKDYEELMGEYYEWYDKNQEESSSLTIQFGKLMKVRKVIAQEKVKSTIELAENIIEQGKKVIIFTNFTDTLQEIYNHFGKSAVYLDGSCSKPHRQKSVDDFQENDKIKVFVGNLKAAGVGITLTSAEAVIMNDLSFVPAEHSQAEDRSHRIGQKNSTSVYYPLFENTIEGAIYDILTRKKKIISTVMGDDLLLDDASAIEEMLNMISTSR
jgi:SNF2 family DNA or RNA helicase